MTLLRGCHAKHSAADLLASLMRDCKTTTTPTCFPQKCNEAKTPYNLPRSLRVVVLLSRHYSQPTDQVYVTYGVPSLVLDISNNGATIKSTSLRNSPTVKYATYTSGNGTTELLFTYTVEAGDATDRLDYTAPAAEALSAPFGSIVAMATLEPVYLRSLPEPGTQGSLGWNNNIVIGDKMLSVEKVRTRSEIRKLEICLQKKTTRPKPRASGKSSGVRAGG